MSKLILNSICTTNKDTMVHKSQHNIFKENFATLQLRQQTTGKERQGTIDIVDAETSKIVAGKEQLYDNREATWNIK